MEKAGVPDLVHRALLSTRRAQRVPGAAQLWRAGRDAANKHWGDKVITTHLHGRDMQINFANPYPMSVRLYHNYNAPQVELVCLAAEAAGGPVRVVDVGAAVGDTALLLRERCEGHIKDLHCVEAEPSFAAILRDNLAGWPAAKVHQVALADTPGDIAEMARSQHQGTASAEGQERVGATTLDALFPDGVDVIKVDTDGFDGRVLAGATEVLRRHRPSVLFEWHPKLYHRLGNDPQQPFDVLGEAGYEEFVFFTKFGQFSHFGASHLERLAELCLNSRTLDDWHYDVAALPGGSVISPLELADLGHWGRSGY